MNSDKARLCIRNVSQSLLREARQKNLPLHHFGLTAFAGESDGEILLDIESMIWELLLTRESIQHRIISDHDLNIESFLHHAARNHWIDQIRFRNGDVRRYFRKQVLSCINSDERFHSQKISSGICFSLKKNARPAQKLQTDDLDEISFPYDVFPNTSFDIINTRKQTAGLAVYFCKAVSALWHEAVYVHITDFIDWLWIVIGEEAVSTSVSAAHMPFLDEEGEDAPDPFDLEPSCLDQWAQDFVHILNQHQKTAFYLRRCRHQRLRKIARHMDLGGPSGVSAHLRNAETRLKSLIIEHLNLSREDVTPSAWEFFLKKICLHLKKEVSNPFI